MRISVITICYNAEHEIVRTMNSVLCQTYSDLEYIIVDGASKDGTLDKINDVVTKYPDRNIKVISELDKGIYDAMNKGIKHCTGIWISMMNAGDIFTTNTVLSDIFSRSIPQDIMFIYSDMYKMTSFGKTFKVKKYCNQNGRSIVHQCVIYKKELHEQYGYYIVTPQLIISDYLFFLQIPIEKTMKTNTIIATYEGNGVSEQGVWCIQQALCANVVYRHKSFWHIYIDFIKWKLKHIVPLKWREYYRLKASEVL